MKGIDRCVAFATLPARYLAGSRTPHSPAREAHDSGVLAGRLQAFAFLVLVDDRRDQLQELRGPVALALP